MIEFRHVSFRYRQGDEGAGLQDVDLSIPRGQVVLVCGVSGCGKTTLTRLVNGLVPWFYDGDLSGEVLVDGRQVAQQSVQRTAGVVGSVFQNPKSQFFNRDSTDEVVFSVNRFGSNYVLVDGSEGIGGAYLARPQDVHIREINVSGLDTSGSHAEVVRDSRVQ